MDIEYDLATLLEAALDSSYGIRFNTPSNSCAKAIRRKCYAYRERERLNYKTKFDKLTFLCRGAELWIVRRQGYKTPFVKLSDVRSLVKEEIPENIKSRGKSRVGIHIS